MKLVRPPPSEIVILIIGFILGVFVGNVSAAEPFTPSRENLTMVITIQPMARHRLREHCASLGVIFRDKGGCTVSYPAEGRATIFVELPKDTDDAEAERLVGHEALHAFFGHYHAKPH